MGLAGRKRTLGHREANGRLQRPSLAQIAAAERESRMKEIAVVVAQPHRRGSDHPWRATALGRFCMAHKLRSDLYDAATEYGRIVHRWRVAKGVPVNIGAGGSAKVSDGPSERTVRDWEARIAAVEKALKLESVAHFVAVRHLILDDQPPAPNTNTLSIEGLLILANTLGWKIGRHPYA